ncbi:S53 family peptidase (plasmid) [Polymorphobacter sp. PAMC 29334]|uniref:S53 family peptidase n=1 Tax=Polymorphobacter sp. PAMC 29334 TaxID=2862331 RepID=UPI001C798344|nr:S53 family peptidase [Polymorphobacter sp. PAMC 29334]QYE33372.1 S53 family peptidase [Polymorphobacter sp. PAMC 29334]
MTKTMVELSGSQHRSPDGKRVGAVPSDQTIELSIYLKDRDADPLLTLSPSASATLPQGSRAAIALKREVEHRDDFKAVADFARAHGLSIVEENAARRLVRVTGPAAKVEAAFGTVLSEYDVGGRRVRGRDGSLTVPADMANRIAAVLGLDTSPIATPKFKINAKPKSTSAFFPNAVGQVYGFPAGRTVGKGQCIGIIELGGGYLDADTAAAFSAMKLPVPKVTSVDVSGGANSPGNPSGADGEVALDIQVAGGVAPGAAIAVYFAPNTSQGFVDAISQAVHDQINKPSVISISWGSAEANWSQQALSAMNTALKDAAILGITVCAASGDGLATDGQSDGKVHVDFPASDPYVLACGGTLLHASGGKRTSETVWNSNGSGTGGGVSVNFAKPGYQANVMVPAAGGPRGGRGVPDVAGNADPNSGYIIVVGGKTEQIGGTSAVAPLWAGLFASINATRPTPVGFAHPQLYGDGAAFHDIVSGTNKVSGVGYSAAKGWDACTGLGSPDAQRLQTLLKG